MGSSDKTTNWRSRPGFGALVFGLVIILISLAPLLLFYVTPHENGIASDPLAGSATGAITLVGGAIGSVTAFIGLIRWLKSIFQ